MVNNENQDTFIEKFSNWNRLIRAVAIGLRWKTKTRGMLSAEEIINDKLKIIKYQQKRSFEKEIDTIRANEMISCKHWLSPLNPMIDDNTKLLQVGGRLGRSNLSNAQRHPILLPKCHLTNLLIQNIHLTNGHGGNTLTTRILRENYWIPSVNQRIKKIIRQCVVCIRWHAKTLQPAMADLPAERVCPAPTFSKTGEDLCGPFNIKASRIKFDKIIKIWVAVFICLVTKAVHLEIVSDLSTEHFLAAFSRFCNRRGCPCLVMSGNGTNFVGASRKLKETWNQILKESSNSRNTMEIHSNLQPHFWGIMGGSCKIIQILC